MQQLISTVVENSNHGRENYSLTTKKLVMLARKDYEATPDTSRYEIYRISQSESVITPSGDYVQELLTTKRRVFVYIYYLTRLRWDECRSDGIISLAFARGNTRDWNSHGRSELKRAILAKTP